MKKHTIILDIRIKVKKMWEIFSKIVAFSEYMNIISYFQALSEVTLINMKHDILDIAVQP